MKLKGVKYNFLILKERLSIKKKPKNLLEKANEDTWRCHFSLLLAEI